MPRPEIQPFFPRRVENRDGTTQVGIYTSQAAAYVAAPPSPMDRAIERATVNELIDLVTEDSAGQFYRFWCASQGVTSDGQRPRGPYRVILDDRAVSCSCQFGLDEYRRAMRDQAYKPKPCAHIAAVYLWLIRELAATRAHKAAMIVEAVALGNAVSDGAIPVPGRGTRIHVEIGGVDYSHLVNDLCGGSER